MKRPLPRQIYPALITLGIAAFGGGYLYWKSVQPPTGDSPVYEAVVKAFYSGTIALEAGDTDHAKTYLSDVTKLAPREPSGWVNLGILQLRLGDYTNAQKSLDEAKRLAPDNARIEASLADLEQAQGRGDEAIKHLRRALQLEPANVRARYALAQALGNAGDASSDKQIAELLDQILKSQPNNLVVLLDSLRLAAAAGDAAGFEAKLKTLRALSGQWSSEQKDALAGVESAARSGVKAASIPVISLVNLLKPSSAYQAGLGIFGADSQTGATHSSAPLEGFLWLKPSTPNASPSPPDLKLAFSSQPFAGFVGRADAALGFQLDLQAAPVVFTANGAQLRRATTPISALPLGFTPGANGLAALDWNFDFRQDLVVAGAGGVRLLEQNGSGIFVDASAKWKLPPAISKGNYLGAFAGDIEADGDLDLVLTPRQGQPLVLRNNGDETASIIRPFAGIENARGFAWADFDDDGAVDAAFIDGANQIRVFLNQRAGTFQLLPPLGGGEGATAIRTADINRDGLFDLLALRKTGELVRLSIDENGKWNAQTLAKTSATQGEAKLFAADLDNNGALDLVASSGQNTHIELADEKGGFSALAPLAVATQSVVDLNSDGKLDLVGIDSKGAPLQLLNGSTLGYAWQNVRPFAQDPRKVDVSGNGRINPFGVGGSVELRAGLRYQKMLIVGPEVHFGLGAAKSTDSIRLTWPNGVAQGEFDLKANTSIGAEQRLIGSCPFLWAFDGKQISFIKDCNWRSPLGLRINGQNTAGVVQTQDWIKVEGDKIAARDGFYDLRVTADLWEAHIFDFLALQVVDHPVGSEMWVDERFSIPMPPLAFTLTGEPQAVKSARDDKGNDVSQIVENLDGDYLDTFGRGQYQGVTRDHFVEIELPDSAPKNGPLWLLAQGWLHPTDSSINVALSQGKHAPPRDLSLEVDDGRGGWKVIKPHLGFPSGKNKTVVLDLHNVFVPGAPRRLRLRTNLEIFWDRIVWAGASPTNAKANSTRLLPDVADLRFRGMSPMKPKNASSPELPGPYQQVSAGQKWRDLVGFYTRFGDVKPLLNTIDDRYVLMNAGDEMRLKFKSLAPPPNGWKRDFVFITDGWTKDGNLNTAYSKTLLPLPLHSQPLYSNKPLPLEQDPAFLLHRRDWTDYHTRWVGTTKFRTAMRPSMASTQEQPQPTGKPEGASVSPKQTQLPGGRG